jgi:hypothetical protein
MMRLLLVLICTVLAGCSAGGPRSSVHACLRPSVPDASYYRQIYPIDYTVYEQLVGLRTITVIQNAEAFEQQFGKDCPGVIGLASTIIKNERILWGEIVKRGNELRTHESQGATLCWFEWTDGKRTEQGVVALKKGQILDREVWLSESLNEEQIKSN